MTAFLSLSALAPQVLTAADGSDREIRKKLQELESRLQELEMRSERAGEDKTAAGDSNAVSTQELRRQLDLLAAEVEKLRSGEPEIEIREERAQGLGLGSSAAAIYRKRQGVSIAGYGEMTLENFAGRDQEGKRVVRPSQLDFLRAILYAGYRFNDRFVFNSEIEFEHASTGKTGEVSVEFAYVDYLASPHLTVRGGLLLMPMGLTNEYHEPNAFLGVRRSETETRIIPTTWREGGFGVLGTAGKLNYRAYLVNALDASGLSSDGLRGGRQQGSKAKATDLAFVGRLDFAPTPGLFFGGSIYTGKSGQGQYAVDNRQLDARVTIGELHGQLQLGGLDLRALYARASVGDAGDLNRARNLTGESSLGEILQGGYVQLGYNVLSRLSESIRVTPFYRFEKVNTQSVVPQGFLSDPARSRRLHTIGLEFRPIHQIAIKSDYQWVRNRAGSGLSQFNVGLGYAF